MGFWSGYQLFRPKTPSIAIPHIFRSPPLELVISCLFEFPFLVLFAYFCSHSILCRPGFGFPIFFQYNDFSLIELRSLISVVLFVNKMVY